MDYQQECDELRERVEALEEEIAKNNRKKRDSHNSNMPPSQDVFKGPCSEKPDPLRDAISKDADGLLDKIKKTFKEVTGKEVPYGDRLPDVQAVAYVDVEDFDEEAEEAEGSDEGTERTEGSDEGTEKKESPDEEESEKENNKIRNKHPLFDGPEEKRSIGGQPGRKGAFMTPPLVMMSATKIHMGSKCNNCPKKDGCEKRAKLKWHSIEYDDPKVLLKGINVGNLTIIHIDSKDADKYSTLIKIDHYIGVVRCVDTGEIIEGEFPPSVRNRMYYGNYLRSHAAYLNVDRGMPLASVATYFKDLYNINISVGSISAWCKELGIRCEQYITRIAIPIASAHVSCHDETFGKVKYEVNDKIDGIHVCKKFKDSKGLRQIVIHTSVTERYSLYTASSTRGKEGIMLSGVIDQMKSGKVAVHDCLNTYFGIFLEKEVLDALCNQHLKRELIAIYEDDPTQTWAVKLWYILTLWKYIKDNRIKEWCESHPGLDPFTAEDAPCGTDAEKAELHNLFRDAISTGKRQNPGYWNDDGVLLEKKGKKAWPTSVNLLLRLEKHEDAWLRWFDDFSVPFTNNMAELGARGYKVRRNRSGYHDSLPSAQRYCNILSVTETVRKQGGSPIGALYDILEGRPPEEVIAW